jgi:hypothetical protein
MYMDINVFISALFTVFKNRNNTNVWLFKWTCKWTMSFIKMNTASPSYSRVPHPFIELTTDQKQLMERWLRLYWTWMDFVLSLFPKQYTIAMIYVAFTLY